MPIITVIHDGKPVHFDPLKLTKKQRIKMSKWPDLDHDIEIHVDTSPHPRLFSQAMKSGKKALKYYGFNDANNRARAGVGEVR